MKKFLKRFILLSILAIILILSSIAVYAETYNSNGFTYTTRGITLAAALNELYNGVTGGLKSKSQIGPEDMGKIVRGYKSYLLADGVTWSDEWQIIREYYGKILLITRWTVRNPTNELSLDAPVNGAIKGYYSAGKALLNDPTRHLVGDPWVNQELWKYIKDSSMCNAVMYMLDTDVWNQQFLDPPDAYGNRKGEWAIGRTYNGNAVFELRILQLSRLVYCITNPQHPIRFLRLPVPMLSTSAGAPCRQLLAGGTMVRTIGLLVPIGFKTKFDMFRWITPM